MNGGGTRMNLPVSAEYLKAAMQDGFEAKEMRLVHRKICDLALPTGRLVACDPFVMWDTKPFTTKFPIGAFPVVLSVAEIETDRRVAFATLRFQNDDPVRWEMLMVPGQNVKDLKEGEMFGYGVDSGTGCFMDEKARMALDAAMRESDTY